MVSPKNMHINNILHTEWVTLRNIHALKEAIHLKESKGTYNRRFEGLKEKRDIFIIP